MPSPEWNEAIHAAATILRCLGAVFWTVVLVSFLIWLFHRIRTH